MWHPFGGRKEIQPPREFPCWCRWVPAAKAWYYTVPGSPRKMMARAAMSKRRHEGGDPTAVRTRILDAAFAAFMKNGYAATSTLEIATRARVSKRELYTEVGNKQEMLIACIR